MSDPTPQPSPPETEPDLFGPSPWQNFITNRRAMLAACCILLGVQALLQMRPLYGFLRHLIMVPWDISLVYSLHRPLSALMTLALVIFCGLVITRHSRRGTIMALAITATFAFHALCLLIWPMIDIFYFQRAPSPTGDDDELEHILPFISPLLPLLTLAMLFRLLRLTPPAPLSAGTALPEGDVQPPAEPLLTYGTSQEYAVAARATVAMTLLWALAVVETGSFLLTTNTQPADPSTEFAIWKGIFAFTTLGPVLTFAMSARWIRHPSVNGVLVVFGLTLGLGAEFIASLPYMLMYIVSSISMGYFETLSFWLVPTSNVIAGSVYIACLWALRRLYVSITRSLSTHPPTTSP